MANAPESILLIWQKLADDGSKVPAVVWDLWEPAIRKLDEIALIVSSSNGGMVSVNDAHRITGKAGEVQRFVRSIRSDTLDKSRVEGGQIVLAADVLQLIVHHIGNDLYVIALIADVPKNNPQPLPSADMAHILERVRTIKSFIDRLKKQTA